MLLVKHITLALVTFLSFSAYADVPNTFMDFQVYAVEEIVYEQSDFQGITGAGELIDINSFSILDDSSQLTQFSNPYLFSVFTKDFNLKHGGIE